MRMREREITDRSNVEVCRSRDCFLLCVDKYSNAARENSAFCFTATKIDNRKSECYRERESDREREKRERESMRRSIVTLSDSRVW